MEANDNRKRKPIRKLKEISDALTTDSAPITPPKRQRKSPSGGISVNGDGNTVINGDNIVNIHSATPPKKVVVVKTGDGTITAAQQAALKALVDEIVSLEAELKRDPRGFGAVWSALNTKMKVTRYVEIHQDAFPAAKSFLMRQRAILLAMRSAPAKATDWRKRRYKSINARAGEFEDGEMRYRRYAEQRFGSGSLKDLDDEQLDAVYVYVFGWGK